jgi:uncharacterized damage-inducible protein DinB
MRELSEQNAAEPDAAPSAAQPARPSTADQVPWVLEDPGAEVRDPQDLLLGYLDWYRRALLRKIDGLSGEQLRTPVEPFGWAPLGLVKHLGWVERRWLRWGFAAQDVQPYLPGGDEAEWNVAEESADEVISGYLAEVQLSSLLAAGAGLGAPSRTGGRFPAGEQAPSLGRILFHLLQEYARHLGQLDMVRELIDGETGE